MKLLIIRPILIILTTALLAASGCAVGPDYTKTEIAAPLAYTRPTPSMEVDVDHWTELYNEPQLTALIEQARRYNYSLDALYQRTLQSRAIINRERAERRPQVDGAGSARTFEDSEELGSSGGSGDRYSAGLTLGWELDIFGRVARLVEAAEAEAEVSQAAYKDLLLLTETDVAINYYRLRALKREIEAVERSVETRRESLKIINERFDSGAVSDLDVAQSETLLAESEADLAALRRTSEAREHALAILTGQYASTFEIEVDHLSGSPAVAPVNLPSELLQRRPDLRQAEFALRAANARVGVATANFYPRLTISGSAGYAALDVNSWFKDTAGFYSIGPEVSLPIFQGERLRSELTRAELLYAESLALYQQAIVEAFAEVEDALSGWRHLATQREARGRAAKSAQRAQSISDKQYRSGLIDFISALDAERTALDAERRLAQVIGDEYENSIRLIRSIGGSWE